MIKDSKGMRVNYIHFDQDGIEVQYQTPEDLRDEGRVIVGRSISLHQAHPDYREHIERLHEVACEAVRDAYENWENTPRFDPNADDEDDEKGMGE